MPAPISLRKPYLLELTYGDGVTRYGANQSWYEESFQRRAGCGPTSAAHLIWYLAGAHAGCAALCPAAGGERTKDNFLPLMQNLWTYVTPGPMGVNTTVIFTEGARRYGADRGVPIDARALPVPVFPSMRPDAKEAARFLTDALSKDLPVAFLNLSNGSLANLDSWHWVTFVAFEPESFGALMYDNGNRQEIDLKEWLGTTLLGGGFVVLFPKSVGKH